MNAWLFTIEEQLDDVEVGTEFKVWTEPPRLTDTGAIRRRADGDPYTPQWSAGEEVIVYHPGSERCVAVLALDGPAVWDEEDELFLSDTTVRVFDPDGPTLADIGVNAAVQGGRQRLTASQHGAAVQRLHPHNPRLGALLRQAMERQRASAARALDELVSKHTGTDPATVYDQPDAASWRDAAHGRTQPEAVPAPLRGVVTAHPARAQRRAGRLSAGSGPSRDLASTYALHRHRHLRRRRP